MVTLSKWGLAIGECDNNFAVSSRVVSEQLESVGVAIQLSAQFLLLNDAWTWLYRIKEIILFFRCNIWCQSHLKNTLHQDLMETMNRKRENFRQKHTLTICLFDCFVPWNPCVWNRTTDCNAHSLFLNVRNPGVLNAYWVIHWFLYSCLFHRHSDDSD